MTASRVHLPCVPFLAALLLLLPLVAPAHATLKLYYDPATGNVSFDTMETRTGGVALYLFHLSNSAPWEFRWENSVRLSDSTLYAADATQLGETSFSTLWRGLYTIGDVFPTGLSEEFWTTSFQFDLYYQSPYSYGYVDLLGGGEPPEAEFIYGPPEGEFVNRWDLVDPDTLTWASSAKLIYRAWSGEVLVDTTGATGGYISSLLLRSDDGAFLPEGFTPFVESAWSEPATEELIAQLADAVEPGVYSIGEILPSGLSQQEFELAFSKATYLGRAGFQGSSFGFETEGQGFLLQFVPEPASVVLVMLGCAGLMLRRRR